MNSRTGICPDEGDSYSPCVAGGPYFFTVPPIDSGECWTPPQKFCITPTPGAFRNQFIKAGTNPYNADACLAKNQDDKPITVGYPDLVVRNVVGPDSVCGTQWFDGGFDICNEGTCEAYGTFTIGGWVSLDGNLFDGQNDIAAGTKLITLSPALDLGECRRFSFRSINLPPNPYLTTQRFVLCADVVGGAPAKPSVRKTSPTTVRVLPSASISLMWR